VKPRIICAALAVLVLAVPAVAQVFEARALPPDEILTILYMAGLNPVGQPKRSGENYVIRAIDGDRDVEVVIEANSGDILSKTPAATASRVSPAPNRTKSRGGAGASPPVARGYGDSLDLSKLNIIVDEPGRDGASPPRRVAPNASPKPSVNTEEPDRDGLPPPPERLPRRAAPAVSPKPVDRTAAVPPKPDLPKESPLPKLRPDAKIEAVPLPSPPSVESKRNASAPSKPKPNTDEPDRDDILPPPERVPRRAAPAISPKPVDRTAAVPAKPEPLPKPRPDAKIEAAPPSSPRPPVVSTRRAAPMLLTPSSLSNAAPPRSGTAQRESGSASAPSTRVIMADPDDGLPPPERVPQRHGVIE